MLGRSVTRLLLLGALALSRHDVVLAADVRITESSLAGIAGSTMIVFEGTIKAGDLLKVQQAFEAAQANGRDVYLALHSPGGLIREALSIAYFLREKGIGTVLRPTSKCGSACAYIFFGGYDLKARAPRRIAYSGSTLAVHSAYLGDKEGKPLRHPKRLIPMLFTRTFKVV
jgi:hypothetical protein